MTRRQAIAILGTVLLLGAGTALVYAWSIKSTARAEAKLYVQEEYAISFVYPDSYALAEIERGDALQNHLQLTLTDEPGGDELPPAITIEIFEHEPGTKSLEQWASSTPDSNYALITGALSDVTVDGVQGIRYEWDGLYQGESIVLPHKGNIVMVSVSYRDAEDVIRADFTALVDSLQLAQEGEVLPSTVKPAPDSFACTMEAKLCPDGSYVGRTGPKCEFTACPNEDATATVQTGLGRSGSGLGIELVPLEVVEDSRCPADVQCIQAGTVRVRTQAGTEASSATLVFELNQPQVVQGKTVTLREVAPIQRTTGVISPSEYVFTFSISG